MQEGMGTNIEIPSPRSVEEYLSQNNFEIPAMKKRQPGP